MTRLAALLLASQQRRSVEVAEISVAPVWYLVREYEAIDSCLVGLPTRVAPSSPTCATRQVGVGSRKTGCQAPSPECPQTRSLLLCGQTQLKYAVLPPAELQPHNQAWHWRTERAQWPLLTVTTVVPTVVAPGTGLEVVQPLKW